MHEIDCTWLDNMAFEVDLSGHKLVIDAHEEFGGENRGPSPKPLTLASLAGCTGMDVVSMLKKMRVSFDGFNVKVNGQLTKDHPKYYDKIHLTYEFTGKDLPLDKITKSVELSKHQYCGVSALLSKGAEITYEIKLNE